MKERVMETYESQSVRQSAAQLPNLIFHILPSLYKILNKCGKLSLTKTTCLKKNVKNERQGTTQTQFQKTLL